MKDNTETTSYTLEYGDEKQSIIGTYECFGWKLVSEKNVHMGKLTKPELTFSRNKENKHYQKIVELEDEYKRVKNELEDKQDIESLKCCIYFLLFIIPGVIYVVAKLVKNVNVSKRNSVRNEIMNNLMKDASQYLSEESQAVI